MKGRVQSETQDGHIRIPNDSLIICKLLLNKHRERLDLVANYLALKLFTLTGYRSPHCDMVIGWICPSL